MIYVNEQHNQETKYCLRYSLNMIYNLATMFPAFFRTWYISRSIHSFITEWLTLEKKIPDKVILIKAIFNACSSETNSYFSKERRFYV